MYLVIKNSTQQKSYQCTNTCNKPRVRVSNSYIPLTNNVQSKPKCIINSMEIASYKSYTYTGEQGTVTTGTTYLTRSSTSNTLYGTQTSTVGTTISEVLSSSQVIGKTLISQRYTNNYYSATLYIHGSIINKTIESTYGDRDKLSSSIYNGSRYITLAFNNIYTFKGQFYTITGYGNPYEIHEFVILSSGSQTIASNFDTTYTVGTAYQTRASTSGTSYGTKTTNKTLTSSSWG